MYCTTPASRNFFSKSFWVGCNGIFRHGFSIFSSMANCVILRTLMILYFLGTTSSVLRYFPLSIFASIFFLNSVLVRCLGRGYHPYKEKYFTLQLFKTSKIFENHHCDLIRFLCTWYIELESWHLSKVAAYDSIQDAKKVLQTKWVNF